MDNFNLSRTLVENINNQNDKINNCIDIVNGLAKDEEIKVIQELRINEELRQQNELIRQQNELSRIETVNEQLGKIVQYNEVFNKYPKPFFVAHRGVSELYPENSIPAFEETSKYDKCVGIETDVMLTADNKWVCMHDETVDRTTDGSGSVKSLTLEQIRELKIDIGNNISMYPNLKVPTFEEYLRICDKYNKIAYIEMKMSNCTKNDMRLLLNEIELYNFTKKCVIISFNYEALQFAREINKRIALGYLGDITDINIQKCKDINGFICPQWKNSNPSIPSREDVLKAHQNGLYVSTWTVNNINQCQLAIGVNVDAITTDKLVGGVQ